MRVVFLLFVFVEAVNAQAAPSDGRSAQEQDSATSLSYHIATAAKAFRPRELYDDIERALNSGNCVYIGCNAPRLRSLENEIVGRVFLLGILKPLLFENQTPSDAAIGDMAHRVAQILRYNVTDDVKNDFEPGNWLMTSAAIEMLSESAQNLPMPAAPRSPPSRSRNSPPPPPPRSSSTQRNIQQPSSNSSSRFVRELGKRKEGLDWRGQFLYSLAGLMRCGAEHLDQVIPNEGETITEEMLDEKITSAFSSCSAWVNAMRSASPAAARSLWQQFWAGEMVEKYSSEENTKSLLKEVVVFIDTLKKRSSYNSFDSFTDSLRRSGYLYSTAIWISEILKCRYGQLNAANKALIDEVGSAIVQILRNSLPLQADPSAEVLRPHVAKIIRKVSDLDVASEEDLLNIVGSLEQWEGCIIPREARRHYDKFVATLRGPPERKRVFLNELKQPAVYGFYAHVTEDITSLRRRPGLSDEGKLFFDKAVIYVLSLLNSLAEHRERRQGGGVSNAQRRSHMHKMVGFFMMGASRRTQHRRHRLSMENLTQDLRASFRRLSPQAKKNFIKHFPFRSTLMLSLLF